MVHDLLPAVIHNRQPARLLEFGGEIDVLHLEHLPFGDGGQTFIVEFFLRLQIHQTVHDIVGVFGLAIRLDGSFAVAQNRSI